MQDSNFPEKLVVSSSPHFHGPDSIPRVMWSVVLALVPALIVAALNFGWYAMAVVAVSIAAAVVAEAACQKFRGVPITISDGSAVVTGMLLAFVIPPNVPLYVPAIGSIFAICIAKHAFGGLGCNIWNPALAGRAFLLAAYSSFIVMPKWPVIKELLYGDIAGVDAVSKATPCLLLKTEPLMIFQHYSLMDLFIGRIPGSIGETSALALIIGGVYLIAKGYVNWRLPFSYVLTVFILVMLLPISDGHGGRLAIWALGEGVTCSFYLKWALAHILSGGLMIGAFFMATDMVTSPLTSKGQVYFGIGCGVLVALIRLYGGYPEGVCYSILIMNTVVWLIDKHSVPKFFGTRKQGSKEVVKQGT